MQKLTAIRIPQSINFHLTRSCNFKCRYCHSIFPEAAKGVSQSGAFRIVYEIAEVAKAQQQKTKITFVGGEPTLKSWLPELIKFARESGLVTMLVTNGSRITPQYLDALDGNLDWVGISIDSLSEATNLRIGRENKKITMHRRHYSDIARWISAHNIRLKVNTVVRMSQQMQCEDRML